MLSVTTSVGFKVNRLTQIFEIDVALSQIMVDLLSISDCPLCGFDEIVQGCVHLPEESRPFQSLAFASSRCLCCLTVMFELALGHVRRQF